MEQENLQIAKDWLAAFNNKNLDALLALYHVQAKHFSPKLKIKHPETNGLIEGKAALNSWWADAFKRLPELHYRENSLTANDQRVFIEYTRQVPGEADMQVAEVLDIQEGKIFYSRVYHG